MNNKLQGKDLINIGIFTAIYFIVIFAAASIGFIPIFIPLISVIVPLVGGIPMMLFFSKIKKFGMLTICGVLLGIIMLLTGMGWWCIPTGLIFGMISDFMMTACDYKNAKREVLIHGVFSMWVIGAFIPIVVTRDAYYQNLLPGYRPGICRHAHGLYARLDFAGTVYCCFRQRSCRRPDWTEDFQKAL